MMEVDPGTVQEAVTQHEIDIAVIRPSAPVQGLRTRPWRHDHFVIALPERHALAKSDLVSLLPAARPGGQLPAGAR
ncbi:LysR substrate-binding domain-containing protein [Streptomyces viridiviolaceus]